MLGSTTAAERCPAGIAAFPAYVVPLAVCGVAGRAGSTARLAAEVAVLAVVAAVVGFEATAAAGPVAVASSVLSLDGFALHDHGRLGWQPGTSLVAAAVLAVAWAGGFALRRASGPAGPHPKEGVSDERRGLRSAHRGPVRAARPRPARAGAAGRRRPEHTVTPTSGARGGAA